MDARVLAFTVMISLATGILFGLAPALRASKTAFNESLKGTGRSSSSGLRQRMRGTLVMVEVALALVLLVSATLMMNTVVYWLPGCLRGLLTMVTIRSPFG